MLLEPERTLKLAEAFDGAVGNVAAKDLLDDHHAPKKLHLVDMPNAQRNRQQSREARWQLVLLKRVAVCKETHEGRGAERKLLYRCEKLP